MKRISYILFFCFFTITANAINEVEAKKVVINYYNLLTEVSQSSDKNRGARDKFGSMFIHAEGWIFNDIEYKINGRKKEDDRIDTYIMSMAGNGLFNAKFTPSNIITTRKGNEWQISYDIDVYKQNRTIYTIPLLMHLNSAGKIRYIGKYEKIVEKIELKSFNFSVEDKQGLVSNLGLSSAHQNAITYLNCNLILKSNIEKDIKILHKIYTPNGKLWTCSNCNDVPQGYTFVTSAHVYANKDNNCKQSFGCSDGNCWEQGLYKWEVWTSNGYLGSKTFEILPLQPNIVDYLEISSIEFVGINKNGIEISKSIKEGGVLTSHQKIKGIKVKLEYTKLSKDISIKVEFDINGKLSYNFLNKWDYSLKNNTTKEEINIKYGNMPQKGKVKIELTTFKYRGEKAEAKTYKYNIEISN